MAEKSITNLAAQIAAYSTEATTAQLATTATTANYATTAGTASTASALTSTVNAGSGTKPIYFSSGSPVASSSTVGTANTPVYLNNGTITAVTSISSSLISGELATEVSQTAGNIDVGSIVTDDAIFTVTNGGSSTPKFAIFASYSEATAYYAIILCDYSEQLTSFGFYQASGLNSLIEGYISNSETAVFRIV